MSFDLKQLILDDLYNTPLLIKIDKIDRDNPERLFQSLIGEYSKLTIHSLSFEKAYLTVITSIIQQRRVYFCLTRRSLRQLMLNNPNYPKKVNGLFSNTHYSLTLAKLINFGLFELVQKGDGLARTASVYKLTHPETLEYLTPLVDQNNQLNQCIKYNTRKK